MKPLFSRRKLLLAVASLWATRVPAQSAGYPTKPVRWILPSPPGSLVDVLARVFGNAMAEHLHQPLVVDNRPGAGGILAADIVAKSPPDGYNLLLATDSLLAINPFIYAKLPYDPRRDFQPISLLGKASVVMVARPALGAKTLPEFIRLAKSRASELNYGSGGNGHTTHLAMALLLKRADLKMTHVPYRGTAAAMQGLLGDEISVAITGLAEALPHIQSGRLVALATSGPSAQAVLPGIGQLKDFHQDLDITFWFALMAPARTPPAVVDALQTAVAQATQRPEVRQKLEAFGFTPQSTSPSTLASMVEADLSKYGPLVRALGIKAE
ncbi:hypothetical protein FQZ97_864420 [compost metagenome]